MLALQDLEQSLRSKRQATLDELEKKIARIRREYDSKISVYHMLADPDLGLSIDEPADWQLRDGYDYTITVPREKLQAIRMTLDSRMQLSGKAVKDVSDRTIWVTLSLDKFPGVQLRFEAVLKDTDQCEMKLVEYPASSSMQLVCKVIEKP